MLYDALGSYTMAWRIAVALGLASNQVAFAADPAVAAAVADAADGVGGAVLTSVSL